MSFVPLHVHDKYSILDGIITIPDLVKKCQEYKIPAVAQTNHGNLYGTIEFYKECQKGGIKPLIGIEAYITSNKDDLTNEEKQRDNYHLVLIAENNIGLKNLYWLSSQAFLHNFYYKPRIYIKHLIDHNEGLICLSACLKSPIGGHLTFNTAEKSYFDIEGIAEETIKFLSRLFKNKFYLEIQDHEGLIEQDIYNEYLLSKGRQYKLPIVITTDAHYLNKEDYETHQMILAQQLKTTITEYKKNSNMIYANDCYIRPPDEMKQLAKKWNIPSAIDNTLKIAEQCNITIELGKSRMPIYDIKKAEDFNKFLKWKEKHG